MKTLSWVQLLNYYNVTYLWLLQVKITAKDLASLEKSKAIISSLTMVPAVGDVYRYRFLFCVRGGGGGGGRGD